MISRSWLDELAARLARTDPRVPFQPVLWGRSMGAAIALRAAALDSRAVALVLEAPMVDIVASTAAVLRRRRLPFPIFLARRVVRRAGKLAGMRIDRPGPVEAAPSVAVRPLIIHGTDDPIVPIREARRLAEAFPSPPRWFDVAGAKHIDVVDKGGELLLEQIARCSTEAAAQTAACWKGMIDASLEFNPRLSSTERMIVVGEIRDFGFDEIRPLAENEDRASERAESSGCGRCSRGRARRTARRSRRPVARSRPPRTDLPRGQGTLRAAFPEPSRRLRPGLDKIGRCSRCRNATPSGCSRSTVVSGPSR